MPLEYNSQLQSVERGYDIVIVDVSHESHHGIISRSMG